MASLKQALKLAALALAVLVAAPAADTRYVLAPSILMGDPAPDAFTGQGDLTALNAAFRQAFETAFPKGHIPLSEGRRLDPGEPTLAVVPRLSVVRVNQNVLAGTLERYEAVVVGDITLVDPWTLTRLFAATRMTMRAVELSRDRPQAEKDEQVRKAFGEAGRAWIQDCLAEIQRNAHPFTLKAKILPSHTWFGLKGGGGLWPFGRLEGVKPGSPVSGPQGRQARVRELFDHFSVIEATAKRTMNLSPDDEYQATLVGGNSAAEREEPLVALRWIGPLPSAPAQGMKKPLDKDGWCGLLANYLSKSGGLRLLPLDTEERQKEWMELAEYFQSGSMRSSTDENDQNVVVKRSRETPDVVAEIGMPAAYYGTAPGENGAIDNRFQVTWGVRWSQRPSDLDDSGSGIPLFKGVDFQSEQKVFRTKQGLRELDLSSLWFNLCRDGIIKLAKTIETGIRPSEHAQRGLAKGGGQFAWSGGKPPAYAKLKWRRFQGTVKDSAGKDLGAYYLQGEPLTVKDLDRCEAQDEILFEAGSSGLQVVVPPPDVQPDLLPQAPWAQARLAALAARLAPMDIMLLDQPLEASPEAKVLKLYAEAQTADLQGGNAILGGVWRLRLYPLESFPAGEPLVKVGLKYSGLFELSAPYQPGDAEAATLAYQGSALEKLVKTATDKGLDKAFH